MAIGYGLRESLDSRLGRAIVVPFNVMGMYNVLL